MRITVLGCGAAYPRAGGACAGFLVSSGDTHVWLDAGNGTFSNLQTHISYRDVDALVLSHSHADHISDVLPFLYALGFDPIEEPKTVALHALPEIGERVCEQLGGTSRDMFGRVFDVRTVTEPFSVGPLRLEPFRTVHPPPTYGFRVTEGDKTLVYTADTAYFDALADNCRDADLLICEATYVEGAEATPNIHLWAKESGKVAAQAGVKRLVLTHIWPTFDPEQAVREAGIAYSGPIEAAIEGKIYEL
jgi:ribonuclease BN (tRNA processing enzyme)